MINVGEDMEKRQPVYTLGGNVNWCSGYVNSSKIKIRASMGSSHSNSGYMPKATLMFIEALFMIAKIG